MTCRGMAQGIWMTEKDGKEKGERKRGKGEKGEKET